MYSVDVLMWVDLQWTGGMPVQAVPDTQVLSATAQTLYSVRE